MIVLLLLHIVAGITAIVAGFISIFAVKGLVLHRNSGRIFVIAMMAMAASGATMAAVKSQPPNIIGGMMALYMVASGFLALRRRERNFYWVDAIVLAVVISTGFYAARIGVLAMHSPRGRMNGVPYTPMFMFAAIAAISAVGDVRMMVNGLRGKQRIARHLWRMGFGLFVASGSFFIGQAKVFPKSMRIIPLLAIPAFLPLVVMLYWLGRVQLTKWYRNRFSPSFALPTFPLSRSS